ncbi:MAG: RraA family protein [Acidimicrobiales bacterium]
MTSPLPVALLEDLRALDTPTVCNALEVVAPSRRGGGGAYTVLPFVVPRPELGPMVGFARTATIRSMVPSERSAVEQTRTRLAYYDHMAEPPGPTITVIEDLDPVPGYGAWWGEVNTSIHLGLGSQGVITNGSIRDIDDCAPGFRLLAGMVSPSHAHVRVEEFGVRVTVHGMTVEPGDLIHADRHGAVVIPIDVADRITAAANGIAAQELTLIEASRQPGFNPDVLRKLMGGDAGH